jgi:SAM-dependent methyltransferase
MARWDDGYVSDVVYTSNFYRECTPTWLATASVLLGHRPPDLTKPFRYADLGCAHAFTALTVAATCPHAEVWGFDFNPAHIENARELAARAGLSNVHFVETSFAQLADQPVSALPEFDFIVSHGLLSWISPENRARLIEVIGQRLRPGGLAYLSYNVTTGWSGMLPLRALMHMLSDASPERSDLAVPGILDYLDRLKSAGAMFFPAQPAVEARMTEVRKQDARYIAHEFLNQHWQPLMFADVARDMSDAKCGYIGSATLSENIDAVSVPAGVVPLLNETRDPILRETLRDFGSGQGFRRDIYRRGVQPMAMAEHTAQVQKLTLQWTGLAAGEQVTIATPLGSVTGRPEIYRPLLAMLEAGPISVREMHATEPFAQRPMLELLQAVALLVSGGYAHPALPGGDSAQAQAASASMNRAVAAMNAVGGDLPRLVAPATGSALTVDLLETLVVGELLAGKPAELAPLVTTTLDLLGQSGRSVQREGHPVTDPGEARTIVTTVLRTMLDRRVPLLRRLGVLPG